MFSLYIYLFIFYIPWIFWDKPHLGIQIVNIDINMLCNVMVYAIASNCRSTEIEQSNTSQSITH